MSEDKYVYCFKKQHSDGHRGMSVELGGKGANLAEMSAIGLPVPPGFTIATACCAYYSQHDHAWPDGLSAQLEAGIAHVEEATGTILGDPDKPLLLSVRSGAAVSMPGMMDTVLNLGVNDEVVEALAERAGRRFAYDVYRRFIDMFGDVVMGVHHSCFEEAISTLKSSVGVLDDNELSADDLVELVDRYKAIYRKHTGYMFPTNPREQLKFAINAVFGSWDSDRAIKYRGINKIEGLIGTGVNVQAMVFGNLGDDSGTGVCFTRNPSTGTEELYGEFLVNAQGEDVVAGLRTPRPIIEMKTVFPKAHRELIEATQRLERHYKNMQDIEFTIQHGELFLLQTRSGKRTGPAAVKIAVDMVRVGLLDRVEAVKRLVDPTHLDQLLHPRLKEGDVKDRVQLGRGLPASPGAAVGQVVFSAEAAEVAKNEGKQVILVRVETSPEDVGGMHAAEGILTSRGGMTSHAAVIARGWGKPCVAGCGDIVINFRTCSFTNGKVTVRAGDWISLNGSTGEVWLGKQALVSPDLGEDFQTFMSWTDDIRRLGVRANADTPEDARCALEFGAEGIGLCRTEHMFFQEGRIQHMRALILAARLSERLKILKQLQALQRQDFEGIFEAMAGHPVTIRLLDPPLHEFLPTDEIGQAEVAADLGVDVEVIIAAVHTLEEVNPMLGQRGCRLGILYPEITQMQARALFEAAIAVKKTGVVVHPEVMVPLVGSLAEFEDQKALIVKTAEAVFAEEGERVDYLVGTMIEVPRAALVADEIATQAQFFSFGTNDLTQMTFGFSRDDAGRFLPSYISRKILAEDPFQVLDQRGVGELVKTAYERGKASRPNLKTGICGEHGGDPSSVEFFHRVGLDYVSCSPFRVPIARLAAAQAALRDAD